MTANHHLDACTRFGHAADGRGVVVGDVVTRSTTVAAAVEFGRGGDAGVNGECGGCAGRSIARFVGGGDGWGVGARRQCCRSDAPCAIGRRSGGEGLTAHHDAHSRARLCRATDGRGGAVGGVVTHQTAVTTAGQGACRCWCYDRVDGNAGAYCGGAIACGICNSNNRRVVSVSQCCCWCDTPSAISRRCSSQGLPSDHNTYCGSRFCRAVEGRCGVVGNVVAGRTAVATNVQANCGRW